MGTELIFDVSKVNFFILMFEDLYTILLVVFICNLLFHIIREMRIPLQKRKDKVIKINGFGISKNVLFVFIALLFFVVPNIALLEDYLQLREELLNNKCSVVEGVVSDFYQMPYAGHGEESFVVKDIKFHYTDYEVSASYHKTVSHGGKIIPGSQVKIFYATHNDYYGPRIVKIEILH